MDYGRVLYSCIGQDFENIVRIVPLTFRAPIYVLVKNGRAVTKSWL